MARRDRLLADARRRLGDAAYDAAWNSGNHLTFHAAVDIARTALHATAGNAQPPADDTEDRTTVSGGGA